MAAVLRGEDARKYAHFWIAQVLGIHNKLIMGTDLSGESSLRDKASLEKIIFDSARFGDKLELASHFLYEIATKHPFWDGNKRTALLTALVVYLVYHEDKNVKPQDVIDLFNSYSRKEDTELVNFMLEVAQYRHTFRSVLKYLHQKLKAV